ncbi:MAG TPA: alanine racemase [Thermoleophilaceae bacterium]|nr:alanine racemase [Thermoleophilaceae bacterium]
MSAAERALARIDLGAITRNCRHLRTLLTEPTQLCAVVKADGYGHGAAESARAALDGGAGWLAVATAVEAQELRAQGIDGRILVMGALTREDLRTALRADADVVAWTEELMDAAHEGRVHVKLDSGMGRLGTKDRRLAERLMKRPQLAGVMTHFATADEPGDDLFPLQLERFGELVEELGERPEVIVHAANSAAVFREPASHFGMVRCGVAIYGMDPFHEDPSERGLAPALSLESWVAQVKRFERGDSAGYGRTWRAERATWVATLPIGYGDGWRRGLSNNCDVLIRGRRHPLVGTISMDNVTADLGPDSDVTVGDTAVLIGAQGGERILAEEVAGRLGTINYEITCGISQRVRREHVG